MAKPAPDKALHFSSGKIGVEQIPPEIKMLVGLIYSYGEIKYGRDNWKSGQDYSQFIGSLERHTEFFLLGEDNDPESTLPHLAHVIWNAGTLLYYNLNGVGNDDREKKPELIKLIRELQLSSQSAAREWLAEHPQLAAQKEALNGEVIKS
jgi:hypothetical protein